MEIDKVNKQLILYDHRSNIYNIYKRYCLDIILGITIEKFIQKLINDYEKLFNNHYDIFKYLNIGNIYECYGNKVIFLGCIYFKGLDLHKYPNLITFSPEKLMFCFKYNNETNYNEFALSIREMLLIKVINNNKKWNLIN